MQNIKSCKFLTAIDKKKTLLFYRLLAKGLQPKELFKTKVNVKLEQGIFI